MLLMLEIAGGLLAFIVFASCLAGHLIEHWEDYPEWDEIKLPFGHRHR